MATRPLVRVLRLSGVPILQQLRLEEALLRADAGNWFLLNDGTPEPAVVMGISGCVLQGPCLPPGFRCDGLHMRA